MRMCVQRSPAASTAMAAKSSDAYVCATIPCCNHSNGSSLCIGVCIDAECSGVVRSLELVLSGWQLPSWYVVQLSWCWCPRARYHHAQSLIWWVCAICRWHTEPLWQPLLHPDLHECDESQFAPLVDGGSLAVHQVTPPLPPELYECDECYLLLFIRSLLLFTPCLVLLVCQSIVSVHYPYPYPVQRQSPGLAHSVVTEWDRGATL